MLQALNQKTQVFLQNKNSRAIIIVTLLLFLSKGLGFIRTGLISQRMDKTLADLFFNANKIPETIVSILVMGTIISSLTPIAARIKKSHDGQARENAYFNLIILTLSVFFILLTICCLVFTQPLLELITSKENWNHFQDLGLIPDYILVSRILLFGPLVFALQAIFTVFLNLKHRFGVNAWAGSIYNLGTIVGVLITTNNNHISTAFGMMAGATITLVLLVYTSIKNDLELYIFNISKILASYRELKKDFWTTWKLFLPRTLILNGSIVSAFFIGPLAATAYNQVTSFEVATQIQGIFFTLVTSAGTVLFPDLAHVFDKENQKEFWRKIVFYSQNIALVALIGSVITFVGAPLIWWSFSIFKRSGVNTIDGNYVIFLTQTTTLALVFQSVNEVLSKYFFVRERIWQPAIISILGLLAQGIGIYWLITNGFDAGFAVSIGLTINAIVLTLAYIFIIRKDYNHYQSSLL